jgi:predicted permease
VLSAALWRELGQDSSIVGQTIELGTARPEVIGVLGPEFDFPRGAAYWRPRTVDPAAFPPNTRIQMITTFVGRARDGVGKPQLLSALRAEETRWRSEIGGYPADAFYLQVVPLADALAGNLKPVVRALLAAVALLLLIACANVASLQLVRTASRARESAVRAALGAGRTALVRAIAAESALLAAVGGTLGIALAQLAVTYIAGLNVVGFPMLRSLRIDGFVLAVAGGTIVLTGVAFGVWPALRAGRVDVSNALRAAGRGSDLGLQRHRALRAGIVAQVALTLVLLAGAGLMVRSLDRLLQVELGFNPEDVMTARIQMPSVFFANPASRVVALDAIHERLRGVPGVHAVGFTNYLPFADGTAATGGSPYTVANAPPQPDGRRLHAGTVVVYGDYFAAMRIPLASGRAFTRAEYGSPALSAIIDDAVASESFSGRAAIGQTIGQGRPGEIVGVIRSVKQYDLTEPRKGIIYWTYPHYAWLQTMNIVVRSTLTPEAVTAAIRTAVAQADSRIPLYGVRSLTERVNDSLGPRRLAMIVLAGFGGASLLLALLGIYAVMTYVIGDRTREIGIRVALGAQRSQLLGMVLGNGTVLAGAGLVAGIMIFAASSSILEAMLYGVSPFDPASLAVAGVLIVSATLVACYVPARRAASVDAMIVLRGE